MGQQQDPQVVGFFLPHFGHGGAEGIVLRLLQGIDRTRFRPLLILQDIRGELLDRLPEDVDVLGLHPARPPRCVPALARLCADRKVSLLVTVTNATNLYALMAASISRHPFATLVTEHTPVSAFLAEAKLARPRRMAIRALFPRADLTGGPMSQIGDDLRSILGRATPPFRTLANPVVDTVGPLNAPRENARHIVSVGRLAPEKRFDLLIDAVALLRATRPDTRLTIFGDGRERGKLEAKIAALKLEDTVSLPGYASDLDAVHGTADVFVCTSRREGLGNALIEAMARGVPVVSFDCPFGPPVLLRGGEAGMLVRTHDAESLATALKTVLDDVGLRARYADAGLHVARDYGVETAVAAYEDAFETAIASARQSTGVRS